jgi:hypothetical protein
MVDRRSDHAGNRRDGFEDDGAMAIALGKKRIGAEAQRLGKAP